MRHGIHLQFRRTKGSLVKVISVGCTLYWFTGRSINNKEEHRGSKRWISRITHYNLSLKQITKHLLQIIIFHRRTGKISCFYWKEKLCSLHWLGEIQSFRVSGTQEDRKIASLMILAEILKDKIVWIEHLSEFIHTVESILRYRITHQAIECNIQEISSLIL